MYLIVGASGFLGSYVVNTVLKQTDDVALATARTEPTTPQCDRVRWTRCDVTKRRDVDELAASVAGVDDLKVVYLAAYHNPDLVQRNPREAWDANVTALSYFVNRLDNVRSLYYPSTDSVYGNSAGGHRFKEGDALAPVNEYGRQKATAEAVVRGRGFNVVRLPFLIGPSLSPHKEHFYDAIVRTLSAGHDMDMFEDSLRSALSFGQVAEIIVGLIEGHGSDAPQTLNVCGDDALSKYDVGLMIASRVGASADLVRPMRLEDSEGIFEAPRAQSTLMDNLLLKGIMGVESLRLEL